jgi:hypothetical protein
LCVIDLARAEQRIERVIARNDEACEIDEKLAANVEEDEEEIESDEAEESVDLGNAGLLLEIVESWVLGEL